ncbi:MAG TPA: TetR/AcrR family transcriptional regulator [Anaerolineae bacterium]|nr:TetR/AcrR family transcriptional regulator [Anaerolineae bacterium]
MTHKMDRRVRRTRKLLGEALVRLLGERGMEEITIREITEEADVAYSTFFRNFESKEGLLLAYLEGHLRLLQAEIGTVEGSLRRQVRQNMEVVFRYVLRERPLWVVLLRVPSAQPALKQFEAGLVGMNLRYLDGYRGVIRGDVPLELVVMSGVGQLVVMLEWWLWPEVREGVTAEVMVDYYEQMVVEPMWRLLVGEEVMRAILDGDEASGNVR